MANLQFLYKLKCILNVDSDLMAHQFLHRMSINEHFEDHPIVLLIIEDLDAILNTVSAARVTSN